MENKAFNGSRFWHYFCKDIRSAIQKIGITLVIFCTISVSTDLLNGLFSSVFTGEWIGMTFPLRVMVSFIFGAILLLVAPSKLYGYVTDRKEGSAFIMLPVSRFEKYLSMILISGIIIPAVFISTHLLLDAVVCKLDHTCGDSIISIISQRDALLDTLNMGVDTETDLRALEILHKVVSPMLYFDDIIGISLIFLLGGLLFKTSKVGKTLGCMILITLSLQFIMTPIMSLAVFSKYDMLSTMNLEDLNGDYFRNAFPFLSWIVRHVVLVDTISDTLTNALLLFLIWLRIKKIKH